jgi:hypothetical protein
MKSDLAERRDAKYANSKVATIANNSDKPINIFCVS